jgi:glycosyltransferase involved in cell wall biosynthesis
MPVYNGGRYLREAVESVLRQSCADFEFVIIDDGSTDGSGAVLTEYARGDARIRLVQRENRGLVFSLNEGIAEARSGIIFRMDADDICRPDRLRLQLDFLDRHPEIVCVGGTWDVIDERGRHLTTLQPPLEDAEMQAGALAGHAPLCHPTAAFRRGPFERVGGYRPEAFPAEDLDLWLRLGEIGKLANLPDVLIAYRLHNNSISSRAGTSQRDRAFWICSQAWARRGIAGNFTSQWDWRPGPDRASQHRFFVRHGWWAFNSGQSRTATLYGLKAVATDPRRAAGWRLLACAPLKRPPEPRAPTALKRAGG